MQQGRINACQHGIWRDALVAKYRGAARQIGK
jgi:hypothetical protein